MTTTDIKRIGRCVVHLKDGTVIDLTGLTAEESIRRLRALGVTPIDVKQTIHYVDMKREDLLRR